MITSDEVFVDVLEALPLAVGNSEDSGAQAPFHKNSYQTAMKVHGSYTCGGDVFWTKFDFTPTPGVPIRISAIETLMSFYFETPSVMPRPVVVSVTDLDANPLSQRGALQAISPEELRCAMLFAIARDVANGAGKEALNAWRRNALSVTMQFIHRPSRDAMYFAACQLRENMGQDHESMSRTALQRVYEIARFRESQMRLHGPGAGSAASVAKAYAIVKAAGNQQPYSTSAIDVAIAVHQRMLGIAAVTERLLVADSWPRGRNPLDSLYKLEIILRKGKDNVGAPRHGDLLRHIGKLVSVLTS